MLRERLFARLSAVEGLTKKTRVRHGVPRALMLEQLECRTLLAVAAAAGDSTGSDVGGALADIRICHPQTDARVRLQAVDLAGNPVSRVEAGQQFYLQAYVQDTRNGLPRGIASADIDVIYDAARVSVAGSIQYGNRFQAARSGDLSRPGLINDVGAAVGGDRWTDKADPSEEDLLFQVLFTADETGAVTFRSGTRYGTMDSGVSLWGGPHLLYRLVDFGDLTVGVGQEVPAKEAEHVCQPQPDARVRLQTIDLAGNPITQVEVGQQFYLQAYVQDSRNGIPKGVVFTELDVAYDPAVVSVAGSIEHGDRFINARSGDTSKPGLINDVGASLWNEFWTDKADPGDEDLLFQVLFTADAAGAVTFRSGAASGALAGHTMLRNSFTPTYREIDFGDVEISVSAADSHGGGPSQGAGEVPAPVESWQNPALATDVNADGFVTPLDALLVINALNSQGPHSLTEHRTGDSHYYDCNGDRSLSPVDALLVINFLNQRAVGVGPIGSVSTNGEAEEGAAGVLDQWPGFEPIKISPRRTSMSTGSGADDLTLSKTESTYKSAPTVVVSQDRPPARSELPEELERDGPNLPELESTLDLLAGCTR